MYFITVHKWRLGPLLEAKPEEWDDFYFTFMALPRALEMLKKMERVWITTRPVSKFTWTVRDIRSVPPSHSKPEGRQQWQLDTAAALKALGSMQIETMSAYNLERELRHG